MINYIFFLWLAAVSASAANSKGLINAVPLRNVDVGFADVGGRDIGENAAVLGQFPYQAAVYIFYIHGVYSCGGSLITTKHVLTAAHCTFRAEGAVAFFGTIYSKGTTAENYTAAVITTHPSFSITTWTNDIGLITLSRTVQLTDNIKTISLNYDTLAANTEVTTSGFGRTNDASSSIGAFLRYATLTTITNPECEVTFGLISTDSVCAIRTNTQSGCNFANGEPVTRTEGSDVVQVALASFVYGDGCLLNKPSAFTRVSENKDFIEKVIHSGSTTKMFYTLEVCLFFLIYILRQSTV